MNDHELITRHRGGDPSAFSLLMRSSLEVVYNFVRPYALSDDDAEDIVQDTFLKVWKYLKRFDTSKKWRPWLFAIARNTALDYVKKKKAIPFSDMNEQQDSGVEFAETLEDTEPLAAELFEHIENSTKLASLLDQLKPDYNSVLMLHYHQELTFEEIAIIMNNPMNTVKSWHRRALLELKKLIIPGAPKK